ncbi:MAG: hypothetical protein ABIJ09_02435, partial [Pseudomonadota bacterium]
MSSRRPGQLMLVCGLLLLATPALAQLVSTFDDSISTQVAAPPLPLSMGVHNGFGGMIGDAGVPVTMAWDSDVLGRVTLDLTGGTCTGMGPVNHDVVVIYIDAVSGGFGDTLLFTDISTPATTAISAGGFGSSVGPNLAPLSFAPGFSADFAIAFTNPSGGPAEASLYALTPGAQHVLIAPLAVVQAAGCALLQIDGLTLAMLGLDPGDHFDWFATLLNAFGGYRSDEFHGDLQPSFGNIGQAPYAVMQFNRFTTVGPVVINEVDADNTGFDDAEFVELYGPPNLRLDGAVLVTYNGSIDQSYNLLPLGSGADLDGYALDASGYFVLGNTGVPNVQIVFNGNTLQNGQDAVALYLANGSDFPASTPVTATSLVDALVYDTDDPDDPGLLNVLTPGQPQINENALGNAIVTSNQRCPDAAGGPLVTTEYRHSDPSPGSANPCAWCGDGEVNGSEDCDEGAANGLTTSCCTTSCTLVAVDTECRAAAGDCDLAEVCTGAAGACPADVLDSTTVCHVSGGACDPAETCNGVDVDCPADVLDSTTVCRVSGGACDPAETCNGVDVDCPADLRDATTVCRVSGGACDPAEPCNGVDVDCPADVLDSTTVCRVSGGACD